MGKKKPDAEIAKEKAAIAKMIARAWKDPEFKKKLLANPNAVLKEMGFKVDENVKVRIHEDTHSTINIVLPRAPAQARELSDDLAPFSIPQQG